MRSLLLQIICETHPSWSCSDSWWIRRRIIANTTNWLVLRSMRCHHHSLTWPLNCSNCWRRWRQNNYHSTIHLPICWRWAWSVSMYTHSNWCDWMIAAPLVRCPISNRMRPFWVWLHWRRNHLMHWTSGDQWAIDLVAVSMLRVHRWSCNRLFSDSSAHWSSHCCWYYLLVVNACAAVCTKSNYSNHFCSWVTLATISTTDSPTGSTNSRIVVVSIVRAEHCLATIGPMPREILCCSSSCCMWF